MHLNKALDGIYCKYSLLQVVYDLPTKRGFMNVFFCPRNRSLYVVCIIGFQFVEELLYRAISI